MASGSKRHCQNVDMATGFSAIASTAPQELVLNTAEYSPEIIMAEPSRWALSRFWDLQGNRAMPSWTACLRNNLAARQPSDKGVQDIKRSSEGGPRQTWFSMLEPKQKSGHNRQTFA
jgi:hypothetical protein